jgi:hypothetical protein
VTFSHVVSRHLSPAELLSLSFVKKEFRGPFASAALTKLHTNLSHLVARNYGITQEQAFTFLNTVGRECFIFGSMLILALVSVDTSDLKTQLFPVKDLDLICVTQIERKPRLNKHITRFSIVDGEPTITTIERGKTSVLMENVCTCLRTSSPSKLIAQHAESHANGGLLFPGELCTDDNTSHPHLRKFFEGTDMSWRHFYNAKTSGFLDLSDGAVVASPAEGLSCPTDVVFISRAFSQKEGETDMHFAWAHILTSPCALSKVCLGFVNDERKLFVRNLEMLLKRNTFVRCNKNFNSMLPTLDYLSKYVRKGVCSLEFRVNLTDPEGLACMQTILKNKEYNREFDCRTTPHENQEVSYIYTKKEFVAVENIKGEEIEEPEVYELGDVEVVDRDHIVFDNYLETESDDDYEPDRTNCQFDQCGNHYVWCPCQNGRA